MSDDPLIQEIQGYMTEIASAFFREVPKDAASAKLTTRMVDDYSETDAVMVDAQGTEKSISLAESYFDMFDDLRSAMYDTAPNQGAWYMAALSVTQEGKFRYEFGYDLKDQFAHPPSEEEVAADLRRFPRTGTL